MSPTDDWLAVPGRGNQAVRKNRVVDDLAAVHARVGDSPTGAGHDHVVRHREVRPITVESVDALKTCWEWEIRIGLPDDTIAVDHDVGERARIPLHAVPMGAVAKVQGVVNVIFRDQNVARGVVDPVVSEVVDLIGREQHVALIDEPNMTFEMCEFVTETQVVFAP